MAVKLKDFDFKSASRLTTSAKGEYPWHEWFDGDIWLLTAGEDFQSHPLMMERVVRTSATNRQVKVNIRHIPAPTHWSTNGEPWGQIVLQRNDIIGPSEAKRAERKVKAAATRAAKTAPVPKAPVKKLVPAKKLSKRPAS